MGLDNLEKPNTPPEGLSLTVIDRIFENLGTGFPTLEIGPLRGMFVKLPNGDGCSVELRDGEGGKARFETLFEAPGDGKLVFDEENSTLTLSEVDAIFAQHENYWRDMGVEIES